MDGWKGGNETLSDIHEFANPVPDGRLIDGDSKALAKYINRNLPEEQAGVALTYDTKPGEEILFKIGISFTSLENARQESRGRVSALGL